VFVQRLAGGYIPVNKGITHRVAVLKKKHFETKCPNYIM